MSLERLTQITTVGIVSGITLREPDASGTTNLGNVTAGVLTATNFIGDGGGLTGVVGSGSGVIVKDSGSAVGTAGTIDFGANLSVSAVSLGIVTVTGAAGGGEANQNAFSNVEVSGQTTVAADSATDTLTLIAGSNMTITTNATNDSVTFVSSGGGGATDKIEEGNTSVEVIDSGTGQVDIDIDGSEKYRFTGGTLNFADGNAIRMTGIGGGTASGLHIDSASGHGRLGIFGSSGSLKILDSTGSGDTNMGVFNKNSSVDLYFDGTKRFETTSTGSIVTGVLTATTFSGDITVTANNSTNETVYPIFVDGATGSQGAESDTGLNYNPSTGNLAATKFTGDGSGLTGVVGSGSGVIVKDSGSAVGTAGTIDFGTNLNVSNLSGAAVTVTSSGSSNWHKDTLTAAPFVGIGTTANVGVGTTAKVSHALDVLGNVQIDGDVSLLGSSSDLNAYNITVRGSIYGSSKVIIMGGDGSDTSIYNGGSAYSDTIFYALQGGSSKELGRLKSESSLILGVGATIRGYTGDAVFSGVCTASSFDGNLNASKLSSGTVHVDRLGSGASNTKFLRGDNTWQTVSGGGSGISNVVEDTTPQLGGNLDLNNHQINGTGDINVTGIVTATGFDNFTWTLGASGTNHYTLTGPGLEGAVADPTIYVRRGQKYSFINRMGSHPFVLKDVYNNATYVDGVVNSGVTNGTMTWNVQFDAPDVLYYQCTAHANMRGKIIVLGKRVIDGSWTASAGSAQAIDTIVGINSNTVRTIEYTVSFVRDYHLQAQKVLIMHHHDFDNIQSSQFGIMYNNDLIMDLTADINSGNIRLLATPESGVSGVTTYYISREVLGG